MQVVTVRGVGAWVQDELHNMQARAKYAESRAAVAEAELQSLRKVRFQPHQLSFSYITQFPSTLFA